MRFRKNSFIDVFEKLYSIDQKKTINIVDKICNELSLYEFISLNNGNRLKYSIMMIYIWR